MKQYWDQIETVVTWWLIPPLWSLPPPSWHAPAQLISPQMPSSGPLFFRTASKSSGYRLLPPCYPMSQVRPSVIGMPSCVTPICVILGALRDSISRAIINVGAEWQNKDMLGGFQWAKQILSCQFASRKKKKKKMIMDPKKQIKCSFIISEEYKLYNKNTSSKYNWEYSKSFTLACCNVTWCIQWKRYALNGPLHFSNSNSTFCHNYLLFPNYRYVQRKKKKRKVLVWREVKRFCSQHTLQVLPIAYFSHILLD